MKVNELMQAAQDELTAEKQDLAKEVLKERLREIASAEKTLSEMKKQLTDLQEQDIADVVDAR